MASMASFDRNMPILVVDDYPSMRRIVKNCLRQLGFENVLEAEGGEKALELASQSPFSLVIADWSMPDMPTLDMIGALRSDPAYQQVPVLIVANEQEKSAVPALEEGAHAELICKPFTRDILREKIESAFAELTPM